ncbi:MAG: Uma2 family endonuclease [Hormoscilla sp. GUM202]|nr:Uma2 family endonuclease [Hormoscilla sp. GUM202]
MPAETKQERLSQTLAVASDWEEVPLSTSDLIFDDGEPLESNRYRTAMNGPIRSVHEACAHRNDVFVGGNMFVYYSNRQVRNEDFRGPDFFVVLGVDTNKARKAWVAWEEGGRLPDVIIELMSPTTAHIDTGIKKDLYEQEWRTSEYFVFDPFNPNSLQGWRLDDDGRYQPLRPDARGWLWSETLELWLGTWSGIIQREPAIWLRFYDGDGNLVPLPEEAALALAEQERERAEQERERAERLAAQLRELGIDPDVRSSED